MHKASPGFHMMCEKADLHPTPRRNGGACVGSGGEGGTGQVGVPVIPV